MTFHTGTALHTRISLYAKKHITYHTDCVGSFRSLKFGIDLIGWGIPTNGISAGLEISYYSKQGRISSAFEINVFLKRQGSVLLPAQNSHVLVLHKFILWTA